MAYSTFTLTGTFKTTAGVAESVTVTVIPSVPLLVDGATGGAILAGVVSQTFSNGVVSIANLPTLGGDILPASGWGYTVLVNTASGQQQSRTISTPPAAGSSLDIKTLTATPVPVALSDTAVGTSALDSLVAAKLNDAASLMRAALSGTYVRPDGAGVARFITRARAGGALKIVGVGDSIVAGTGATPGTNDFLTLVKNACDTQFAATVTQSNRGLSGATVATSVINGYFASAIADAGDLYVIMFAKNDTIADTVARPRQGYPRAQSIRGLEVMVREIRRNVPQADIIVASANPNTASDTTGNANLVLWNAEARQVADAYGCEWVDIYSDWIARGDYSALLSDSVHPSVAGHDAIADVILDHIPATAKVLPSAVVAAGSVDGVTDVAAVKADVGLNGWRVLQSTAATQDGVWVNSGTWSGSNPYQTSTATDYAEITFVGTELLVRFSTATADAAVVDIAVDGATIHTDLALSELPSNFQPFLLVASGLTLFQHKVKITLKSGTLKIYQVAWLAANIPQAASTQRKLIGGRYYGQSNFSPATVALAVGDAWAIPFYVPVAKTLNQLAFSVTTAGASSTVTLGVYGADEYDQPLGLEVVTNALSGAAVAFVKSEDLAVVLQPGWHWLAALCLGAGVTVRCNLTAHDLVTTAAESTASALNGYKATGLTELPKRWTATTAAATAPRVVARFN